MATEPPHNVILFVADGLRGAMADDVTAPNMAQLARQGVHLRNGHSLCPTLTTANASAMATGHYFGDTGGYSNTIYTGFPVPGAAGSVTPFIENDQVLGDLDQHFGGYLDEPTILQMARGAGHGTTALGKLGISAATNIVVTADHGFSTISKGSATSPAARASYADVPAGFLPPGFVGIDIAHALGMPLRDPDNGGAEVKPGSHGKFANALIGGDPARPKVVVATNGGSDLI